MPYTKFIFTAVIGAIIGYITNWLAIKMLFRPHEEKKIFGIRIPFTPGLIPKEQKRIARSVSDAIGDHLLTSDTMLQALKDNGMNEKLKIWVGHKTKEFCMQTTTVAFQIKRMLGSKFESFIQYLKEKISYILISFIKKDEFKDEIENLILTGIKEELSKNPKEILESSYYTTIRESILKKLNECKNSDKLKEEIQKIMEGKIDSLGSVDKTLDEVIPNVITSNIKVYVYNKNGEITNEIKKVLNEDKVKNKFKGAISDMIGSNLNPMIAMFLNGDIIYDKISVSLNEYLSKEESQKEVALFINDIIDKIMKVKINSIVSNLSEDNKKRNAQEFTNIVLNNIISNSNLNTIVSILEEDMSSKNTIEDMLLEVNINSEEISRRILRWKINSITEDIKVENDIKSYISKFVDSILNTNICDVLGEKGEIISKVVSNISETFFNIFITTKAMDVIEAFQVKKIVENRINSFEVSFAEKIILDIASKELNAITWLGALLGFIMGLLSSIVTIL